LQAIFAQKYIDQFRFLSDWSDSGYSFGRLDSPSHGMIVDLVIHDEWKLAYADLSAVLKTAIECYRRGIFAGPHPDFYAYYKLAAKMNPGMENWEGY
jgi:hypothetical protein